MSDFSNKEEIYSRPVRAGKRTYFFDVKATRGKDLYMTITESKRHFDDGGGIHYQKHKIFLYQEDFDKFEEGFLDAVDKIQELVATGEFKGPSLEHTTDDGGGEDGDGATETGETSRDVEFDDL